MDKLTSVLKLAKEIVALLEAPTAIKKPTPQIIATGAAAAAASLVAKKKTPAAKPAKPVKQKSKAAAQKGVKVSVKKEAEGTFNTLPKDKQVYLLKKEKEAKAFFKREYPSSKQLDVNRYVDEVSKECIRFGHVTHPRKFTMKEWKEFTDNQFDEAFYDVESDDDSSDDESNDGEIKYEFHV
jgi:hypothetical protein